MNYNEIDLINDDVAALFAAMKNEPILIYDEENDGFDAEIHFRYNPEKDCIEAGEMTNAGMFVEYISCYEHYESLDRNIEYLDEMVRTDHEN